MTRVFDDWTGWVYDDPDGMPDERAPFEIVNQVLAAVRERETKTVACLGRPSTARLRFLTGCFARVISVHEEGRPQGIDEPNVELRERSPFDLEPFRGAFDAALVVEPMGGSDLTSLDRRLAAIHDSLVEGGLAITVFPAAERMPVAREIRLRRRARDPHCPALHEIEVQYRLRRAGFRGLRLRRVTDYEQPAHRRGQRILAVAIRRANN